MFKHDKSTTRIVKFFSRFSYNFNCPMPPKQNRFAVAIEAGEKNVLKKDGSLLHE